MQCSMVVVGAGPEWRVCGVSAIHVALVKMGVLAGRGRGV